MRTGRSIGMILTWDACEIWLTGFVFSHAGKADCSQAMQGFLCLQGRQSLIWSLAIYPSYLHVPPCLWNLKAGHTNVNIFRWAYKVNTCYSDNEPKQAKRRWVKKQHKLTHRWRTSAQLQCRLPAPHQHFFDMWFSKQVLFLLQSHCHTLLWESN